MWAVAEQRSAPQPDTDEQALPVSVERVYEGLQRAPLKIPPLDSAANFRIRIEERTFPLETVLEAVRRELAAQVRGPNASQRTFTGAQPLIVSPNMIDVVTTIVGRINKARRERAERVVREEIAQELTAFCAEHDCSVYETSPNPHEGIILPP